MNEMVEYNKNKRMFRWVLAIVYAGGILVVLLGLLQLLFGW